MGDWGKSGIGGGHTGVRATNGPARCRSCHVRRPVRGSDLCKKCGRGGR